MSVKKLFSALAVTLALALVTASAAAQDTRIVQFGSTNVNLSSGFLDALKALNVKPGVIAPTRLVRTQVNFPVIGGAIDLDTAVGNIEHSGGLTLTAGNTVLGIQNFIIDTTGNAPVITGLAVLNGALVGRITLFDLQLPSGFSLPIKPYYGCVLYLPNVTVNLNAGAAATLNQIFGTNAFAGGIKIGTATVQALTSPEDGSAPGCLAAH
jgi:hypothetical protein